MLIYCNTSETINTVNLTFFSIYSNFIKYICVKFSIPYPYQSPYIGRNWDGGIFHNFFRIRRYIVMKVGPITWQEEKQNKIKKIDDDVRPENCELIVIYGQFAAIRNPDSWCILFKTYILINNNLFILQKLKTELKFLQHSSSITLLLRVQVPFLSKMPTFCKKYWHQ